MDSVYEGMTDSEMQVANYLQELDLWWWYEHPVFLIDEKNRPRVWAPDFLYPKVRNVRRGSRQRERIMNIGRRHSERMRFTSFLFKSTKDRRNGRNIW